MLAHSQPSNARPYHTLREYSQGNLGGRGTKPAGSVVLPAADTFSSRLVHCRMIDLAPRHSTMYFMPGFSVAWSCARVLRRLSQLQDYCAFRGA